MCFAEQLPRSLAAKKGKAAGDLEERRPVGAMLGI